MPEPLDDQVAIALRCTVSPVVRMLLERARNPNRGCSAGDNAKIGLVVEGGGMRGVVSAGMITALEWLGLTDCFDVVIGASAGAINAAYFLAHQAPLGLTIYYDVINGPPFIDISLRGLAGLALGRPIMHLDYLVGPVMTKLRPLDTAAVLGARTQFAVVASSIKVRKALYLRCFVDREELLLALRAGATIPVVAGPPVSVRGHACWDASLYDSIPVKAAAAEGCTHILVLRSRPAEQKRRKLSALDRLWNRVQFSRYGQNIASDYQRRPEEYARVLRWIDEMQQNESSVPQVYPIVLPATERGIGNLALSRPELIGGAVCGARAVFRAFGVQESPNLVGALAPYDAAGRHADLSVWREGT